MTFLRFDGLSVGDWPGESPMFDFRSALEFTELGMEREGFYATLQPIMLLRFCKKHRSTIRKKPKADRGLTLF